MSDNGFLNLAISPERNRCDFYVEKKLYQVSYTIQDEKIRKREIDGLDYFMEEFELSKSVLVTYDTQENKRIKVQSIESFFLDS